jgi:thiol-disulfide isomerase/thioredoxin
MIRITFVIIGMLVVFGCRPSAPPVSVGNKPISINDVPMDGAQSRPMKPVPEMSWTDRLDGNVQKLKDLQGKVVILDFWATYCPPCIEEIPHLMELKTRYGDDLEVIGLHVGGEEDEPKVPEFVERLKITYPLAYPEEALTAYVFNRETAIPQTAVFDRSGRMVKRIAGFNEAIKTELDQAVAEAIEKR